MSSEQNVLTLSQGQDRIVAALAERHPGVTFRVREEATLAREFGWVFTLDVAAVDAVGSPIDTAAPPLLALIHKVSAQAVSTSRPYTPEQLAKVFEKLLARRRESADHWCLTMHAHLGGQMVRSTERIAAAARNAGLEELAAATKPGTSRQSV
ncbi:MAG: hypothetical protein U0Q11_16120 [Vicinamibacterales bacterium]